MGYIRLVGGSVFTNASYTLRGFTPDFISTEVSELDVLYHSPTYMGNLGVGSAVNVIEVTQENWTGTGGYTQTVLDAMDQNEIDLLNQNDLIGASFASEDVDGTFNPGIKINNVTNATVYAESKVVSDNLLASPFDDPSDTYYLQMPIWSFPASSTADLANCKLIISSSDTYAPEETVAISFDSPDLIFPAPGTGGNWLFRVNREVLTKGNSLTTTGFPITDAVRSIGTALGTAGDGRVNDDSFGIWEASSNLVTNGGAEVNTTGWSGHLHTLSRDTTISKFGTACFKMTHSGSATTNFGFFTPSIGTAGTYSFSSWVYLPSGTAFRGTSLILQAEGWTGSTGGIATANLSKRDQWQYITGNVVIGTADLTGNIVFRYEGGSVGDYMYFDGVQLEQKNFPTPYISTSAGVASRSAAAMSLPASGILDVNQGWWVARVRAGVASTVDQGSIYHRLFDWQDTTNERIYLAFDDNAGTGAKWILNRYLGGTGQALTLSGTATFAKNEDITVAGYWSGTTVAISINGSAWTTASNTQIPNMTNPGTVPIYIGARRGATQQWNGDFHWVAMGTGTLTNADIAALHGLGNARSIDIFNLPLGANAYPTLVWNASTARTRMSKRPDATNIQRVRMEVKGQGTVPWTFRAENLKLIPSGYPHYTSGVNTKVGRLKQERWPGIAQTDMPAIVQDNFTAKNYSYVVKFLSGNAPTAPDKNEFSIYLRVDSNRVANPDKYIRIRFMADSTKTTIEGYEGSTLKFTQDGVALTQQREHVMVITLDDNKIRASVYEARANRLKALKIDTNSRITTITDPGLVGFDFKPYYGNFQLDYMYAKDIVLAEYKSKPFESVTPVAGVTLFPYSSDATNLLYYGFEEDVKSKDNLVQLKSESGRHDAFATAVVSNSNDIYVSTDTTVSVNGSSLKVTKDVRNAYIAGIVYPEPIRINDLKFTTITGYLRFENILQTGVFRVVLWDKWRQRIMFVGELKDMIPNKWNEFELPMIVDVYCNEFILEFHHAGTVTPGLNDPTTGSFWVEDLQLRYKGIVWEASNNNGNLWMRFFDNVGEKYKSIKFPNDIYSSMITTDNVRTYMKFKETSGNFLYDSSQNGNNGFLTGTANVLYNVAQDEILLTETHNSAMRFNSGATATISNITGLSTAAVSVETWIKTQTNGAHTLGSFGGTANGAWSLATTAGSVSFSLYQGGTPSIIAAAPYTYADDDGDTIDPKWHHIVGTYDRNYLRLYIDGVLRAATYGTAAVLAAGTVTIPGPASGYRVQDEFAVYANAITEEKVARHYFAALNTYDKLVIRARAYSTDAWISGYEAVPHYAQLGKIVETTNQIIDVLSTNSAEAFGALTITRLPWVITISTSVASGEAFGTPSLVGGIFNQTIFPNSVSPPSTDDQVGRPRVEIIASVSPQYRSNFTTQFGGSQYVLGTAAVPPGAQTNDILIGVIMMHASSGTYSFPTITWPSGWIELAEDAYTNDATNSNRISYAWRRYTAGANLGTVTRTPSATPTPWSSLGIVAYSSASTGTAPIDFVGNQSGQSDWGSTAVITGGTTTVNKARVILAAYHEDTRDVTDPGGMTRRILNGYTYLADYELGTAGTTGNKTLTAVGSAIYDQGRLFAIKPLP